MVNINLTTEKAVDGTDALFKKELLLFLLAVLLVAGSYAGITVYRGIIGKKIAAKEQQYVEARSALVSPANEEIFDFQNRIKTAKSVIVKKDGAVDELKKMEELILKGVYIDSFGYDQAKSEIALSCIGDDYGVVANQILNFKRSGRFASVAVAESSNNETSDKEKVRVKFAVTLSLNK